MSPVSPGSTSVFYESGSSAPIKEFYIKVENQFERWIRIDDTIIGLVDQLAPGLSFAGQPLAFREVQKETGSLRLERVGCAGPFRVQAEFGQGSRAAKVYIVVGDQTLLFNATARSATDVVRVSARAAVDVMASALLSDGALNAHAVVGPAFLTVGSRPWRPGGAVLRQKVNLEAVRRRGLVASAHVAGAGNTAPRPRDSEANTGRFRGWRRSIGSAVR